MFAYRCFRIRQGQLGSLYVPYQWEPGVNQAECAANFGGAYFGPGQDGPCEEVPNRSHPKGCGFYARIDLKEAEWVKRCNVVSAGFWPFTKERLTLGLVWAGGRIVEHVDNVIRSETMEVLLLAGWADVAPMWQDYYLKVPSKRWESEAEDALRSSLERWLSSSPATSRA